MISSGELFLLNSETNGQFCPLPQFLNQNVRVISAGFDRAFTICEPAICREDVARRPVTVWCFQGNNIDPYECHEFSSTDGDIRQIAVGEKHLLVLTHTGEVYSKGESYYGSVGHGGGCSVQEFKQIPALKNRNVRFVAAGPHFSIAITAEGDVFSWGQSFNGETGLFSKVETVPRFASSVTPFRITSVSCGNAHVLACTESSQCIAWGENTCGQLGVGQKSKAVHKPQVVGAIPSHVASVSAGWAHSVAVTTDGRVYTWGLNTHGQLGLGDTETKFAVHLVHALDGKGFRVASANASRTFTAFRTEDCRALICGSIPRMHCDPNNLPRRPGESDPPGCVLTPVPLDLGSGVGVANNHSEISMMCAFDGGAIGFARSSVFTVLPSLAPLEGGTQIQAFVTGLPYEQPQTREEGEDEPYLQDLISIKVRLKSFSPVCDVTVEGRIVDVDTIEFISPNVVLSPLTPAVENGGCAPVSLQVSIDGGLTWTAEQSLEQPDLSASKKALEDLNRGDGGEPGHVAVKHRLQKMQAEIDASAQAVADAAARQATLWYCKWPAEGPANMTPECAPVSGGTELLLYVNLPEKMPTTAVTVKFSCEPVNVLEDESKYANAPVLKDMDQLGNVAEEEASKLPLAGPLDVFVCGHLDPGGRGVRCISPPLSPENVNFFRYHVELSLDGRRYLSNPLPFTVYDLRITGLSPNVGPLSEATEVVIECEGLVRSEIQKVKLTFPWGNRELPAAYDNTINKIKFMMPELNAEVRQNVEAELGKIEERNRDFPTPQVGQADNPIWTKENGDVPPEGGEEGGEGEPIDPMEQIDKDGGLHALETCVELSLNGQNFTDDKISFTYYGTLTPEDVVVVAGADTPEGQKDKPAIDAPMPAGTVLGVAVKGLIYTEYAKMRFKLMKIIGEEPVEHNAAFELTAELKFEEKEPGDDTVSREMITAKVPAVLRDEQFGEDVTDVQMSNFEISLNGQHWVPCKEQPPLKLELVEPPPPPE